jgi:putative ABC transport system permease protein
MLKNYFQTALRFLKQNKLFAGINLFGLSIALATSFVILLYIINELSYDHIHNNRKNVYRVLNFLPDTKSTSSATSYILGSSLKEKFPQIEKMIRTMPLTLTFKTDKGSISETAISTDSEVFDIFTLPLIDGSVRSRLLEDKNSIIISRDLAVKLFGSQNALGKDIMATTTGGDQIFTVKGVFENIPENSTFRTQCLISGKWSTEYINNRFAITNSETSWIYDMWSTWVLLSDKCDTKNLEININTFTSTKVKGRPASVYSFQNLLDVYLGSEEIGGSEIRGNISSVRIFSAIAFLILFVAALNYIILSTAISTSRTKEIAIRKSFGAAIDKIRNQFLSESLLMIGFAMPIALLLMWLILPLAERLFQTHLHIMKSNIDLYILSYLILVILIGVASGFYTSSYLSRLKVLDIISNASHGGKRKHFFHSALIVLQLIIFCSALSGALIIRSQYTYAINNDFGYYNTNILFIELGKDFSGYTAFLNTIKSNQDVIMAAGTRVSIPMVEHNYSSLQIPNYENKEIQVMVMNMNVDFNYFETMGMSVIEGRDFSEEYGSDVLHSIILNETAIKQLGITEPLKEKYAGNPVIGVVKDFNLFSIHSEILPIAISINNLKMRQIAVHYKPGKLNSILPVLQTEWKKFAPDKPLYYTTIEEVIKNLYFSERNLTTIVTIFALLSLLISVFGLFGLTLFLARSRTKEVGIKKIFGSSENAIVIAFLRENFILVSIAAFLSVPVTLPFMMQWLSRFSFKTDIGWWVFLFAYLCAIIVVLLTVLYHSYKVSLINPIKALRYE